MKQIWQQKIKELNIIIGNTPINDVIRINELYRKRELLENAFNKVEG